MYHFFFVPLSIGLGLVMVLFERRYYKSGKPEDRAMSEMWIKIFAATFAIGVATGITMEFAFGTNWATYSRFVGDIFGAPLAAEGLFAFFLESTFLGVLIFGRNRVSKKFYYVSTWLVWLGSLLSALWIIIANSWMQTPAGYEVIGEGTARKAVMTNFFAAALNPSTLPRYLHTDQRAAHRRRHDVCGRRRVPPAQGRPQGVRPRRPSRSASRSPRSSGGHAAAPATCRRSTVVENQPVKMAAMEGHWETGPMPLGIIGFVDSPRRARPRRSRFPGGVSFLASGTFTKPLPGPQRLRRGPRPPLQVDLPDVSLDDPRVRGLVLVWRWAAWWLNRKGKLENNTMLLKFLMWAWLLPELGIQLGWAAAEIGRQPWIVTPPISNPDPNMGLRTVDAISKVVPAYQVAMTLAIFFVDLRAAVRGLGARRARHHQEGPVRGRNLVRRQGIGRDTR